MIREAERTDRLPRPDQGRGMIEQALELHADAWLCPASSDEGSRMPKDQPRLDRTSLARLGIELQAAHHRAEKAPLTEQQKDLLLQWAVAEALTAARGEGTPSDRPHVEPGGALVPLQPPLPPQPISSAPTAPEDGPPVVLLLYAPHQGGWHTGFWSAGRWRTHLSTDAALQPTHWLPPMLGPIDGKEQGPLSPKPRDVR